VTEQRPVRLIESNSQRLPVPVVPLGEVDGDDPVGVPGGDLLAGTGQQVEGETVLGVAAARCDGQAEVVELIQQPSLAGLGPGEGAQGRFVAVGRTAGASAQANRRAASGARLATLITESLNRRSSRRAALGTLAPYTDLTAPEPARNVLNVTRPGATDTRRWPVPG
jgi:hypothetical protein